MCHMRRNRLLHKGHGESIFKMMILEEKRTCQRIPKIIATRKPDLKVSGFIVSIKV